MLDLHTTTKIVELYISVMQKKSYFNFDKYLHKVRSKGRYCITLTELQENSNLSYKAIQQSIFRAKTNKKIAQIRQGFYVIIPPEYSISGILPVYLYIDDLMIYLKRNYYLGLFSAAILHGAGHQQTMNTQLVIEQPSLRKIKNKKLEIESFTKNSWNKNDIIEKKTDAGYIKVSSPELTALDLIYFHKRIGGINRTLAILEELSEIINPIKMLETALRYNSHTTIQRLGFLFDNVFNEDIIANSLFKVLKNTNIKKIPLSLLSHGQGENNEKWNVVINTDLDY